MAETRTDPWLTTKQVADYLQMAPNTLHVWRGKKIGPRYYRMGRQEIRYRQSDVDSWLDSRANVPVGAAGG